MKLKVLFIFGLAVSSMSFSAGAHPVHWPSESIGIVTGLCHPLSDLGHILTMLALGFCASRFNRRAVRILPLTFVALMLIGGGLNISEIDIADADNIVSGLTLILLLLLIAKQSLASFYWLAIAMVLALFHGYVHAFDIWLEDQFAYTVGFSLSTWLLMQLGIGLRSIGEWLKRKMRDICANFGF